MILKRIYLMPVLVAALCSAAAKPEAVPVKFCAPAYRGENTVETNENNGATFTFKGAFPSENEYELFTSPLPEPLDPHTQYELSFKYQSSEPIDDVVLLYPAESGGDNRWAEARESLPASEEWAEAAIPLYDRFLHNSFGKAPGAALRVHFRTIDRQIPGHGNHGRPLTISVRDAEVRPMALQAGFEAVPLAVDETFGGSAHECKGDIVNISYKGNYGEVGEEYTLYDALTSPLSFPLLPDVDYRLCFDYKGEPLDLFTVIYYSPFHIGNDPENRLGGDNSKAAVTAISRSDGWTSVSIPLEGRRNARDWGYHTGDRLRILFNDSSRLSRVDGSRYGLPLDIAIRSLRLEPVGAIK